MEPKPLSPIGLDPNEPLPCDVRVLCEEMTKAEWLEEQGLTEQQWRENVAEANNHAAKSIINAPILPSTLADTATASVNEVTAVNGVMELSLATITQDSPTIAFKPPITLNEIAAGNQDA